MTLDNSERRWRNNENDAGVPKGIRLKDGSDLTLGRFLADIEAQGGHCPICGIEYAACVLGVVPDHNHKTGLYRGPVCGPDNRSAIASVERGSSNREKLKRFVRPGRPFNPDVLDERVRAWLREKNDGV